MDLIDHTRAACALDEPKVLRFSQCNYGFQWASARTNSLVVMRYLLACWNHRREILALIEKDSSK